MSVRQDVTPAVTKKPVPREIIIGGGGGAGLTLISGFSGRLSSSGVGDGLPSSWLGRRTTISLTATVFFVWIVTAYLLDEVAGLRLV